MGRQLLRATVVLTAGLWLAGCATLRVSSHSDQGLVWTNYQTFEWGPADALPAGDPRLDRDPFFQDHVEGAIEKAMSAHGFTRSAAAERPDVVIHYHANVAERLDVDHIDRGNGYCASDDCRPRVSRYEAGTLVVDIVDAASNVLIWRGWAQGSLEGVLGDRDRLRRRIDDSVTQMFETLPQVR
jgi:uncharacterized protein DUF4136